MSSKRHLRKRSCASKHRHATHAEAVAHLIHMNKQGHRGLHAYKCDFGDHWHVGHMTKEVRQARRAKEMR